MQNITTSKELLLSIQQLEQKQKIEGALLKVQFQSTYESLRPSNLIKNTLKELAKAPDFKEDILDTTISLGAGYLSKKAAIGSTHNPLKQLLGTILQMGVTNFVSKNTSGIKSVGKYIMDKIFTKKEDKQ
jgi:hypothetical protein